MSNRIESDQERKKKRTLTILLVLLGLGTVSLGILAFNQASTVQEKKIVIEKREKTNSRLEKKVGALQEELEALEIRSEELNAEYNDLKDEVAELRDQVGAAEKSVAQLRKLRDRYFFYKGQIKKLKARNADLESENRILGNTNKMLFDSNKTLQDSIQNVSALNQKLEDSVAIGSVVKAYDYEVTLFGTNFFGNEKPSTDPDDIERVEACFTLQENPIAEKGKRYVYFRVVKPDGSELTPIEDETTLFSLGDTKGHFTAEKEIDYQGQMMEVCMDYTLDEFDDLTEGTYSAELYMDQKKMSGTSFTLE